LFTAPMLPNADRTNIIDTYPPVCGLSYVPHSTFSEARNHMNRGQVQKDSHLRSLQRSLSGDSHPLDTLGRKVLNRRLCLMIMSVSQ
ncbi:hypothetical protein BCV72DRAFT_330755, partial [Rhizopus microsporus var. microsporus]